ncbi:uncharacterized protein LOC123224958 [Mangifera indica]|uniref:uncharacterized protein LOC123224958 n=1 Tax=Mangifera indica TaxID=29780 RepID=UPI001CFB4094|nr:uncharacterized protein LOC123224958 [Mangifera indica]
MATTLTCHTESLWRVRLGSALRTSLACIIVGCSTLYGPEPLRRIPAFPAFSYLTTILIVSDATLGGTLKGCWNALFATVQFMLLSILSLRMIGPERFTSGVAAAVVAVTAFVVALPEKTDLMAKRIAFGQIVIVYVGAVIQGAETGVVMHPIHVASSTALGALACVFAMIIPYPRLAYYEVRKACRLYAENASQRFNVLVKAFCAKDKTTAVDSILEAKSLLTAGARLLLSIKDKEDAISWERPQIRMLKSKCINPGEKLQELEIPIRGMELALNSCRSFPVGMVDEEVRDVLETLKAQIGLKLEKAKCYASFDAATAPKINKKCPENSLWTLGTISSTEDAPASFFFYCIELLRNGFPIATNSESVGKHEKKTSTKDLSGPQNLGRSMNLLKRALFMLRSSESFIFALKCSVSLGLAVFFGLVYNREEGYWSGLMIAISFARNRQATFTAANARAQGTVMGSVYGILCCFMLRKIEDLRFLLVLPWIIFTSFLKHSRMYGEAGSISAVIGALLILGRRDYGSPTDFAITRITEATIGLICSIVVEVLCQPTRAATLARTQLANTLEVLHEGIKDITLPDKKSMSTNSTALGEKHNRVKSHVLKLENFIAEAESEPNFWFLPFNVTCYRKLLGSLSTMVDLLLFVAYKIESLSQASERYGVAWDEFREQINEELEIFNEKIGYSLKCFKEVIWTKSLVTLAEELQERNVSYDIELGRLPNEDVRRSVSPNEEDILDILSSFLQHSNDVANKINTDEGVKLKSQIVVCLNGLGFCISSLMRETTELEKELKELLKWEYPTRNINLYEISSQLNAFV